MVSFTTLLALSASALASPVPQARQIAIPENWNWHVSGWEAGCSRGGCYYNFNVTIPSVEGQILGAKAYCNGNENGYYKKGNWYTNCQILEGANNGVAAKLGERGGDRDIPLDIDISFTLDGYEDRPTYNFSGSHAIEFNQFVAPLQEFDLTPTQVFGIA